jgi:hypothetical protein
VRQIAFRTAIAVLVVGAVAIAQKKQLRDPQSFEFKEAVIPKAVVNSYQADGGFGNHPRGSEDPVFAAQELLGRPTDTSITISAAAMKDVEAYYEYGTKPGAYSSRTQPVMFVAGEPKFVQIDKLKPKTRYYYRMEYKESGATKYAPRAEHSSYTQRAPGSTFTYVLQFDPHMMAGNDPEAYKLSLKRWPPTSPIS